MLNSINAAALPKLPVTAPSLPSANADGAQSFQDLLLNSLNEVNSLQQDANQAVETLATGGDVNPAEVLSAVQKADIAFRLMMQVRNKLVQAYQDVQQIRV